MSVVRATYTNRPSSRRSRRKIARHKELLPAFVDALMEAGGRAPPQPRSPPSAAHAGYSSRVLESSRTSRTSPSRSPAKGATPPLSRIKKRYKNAHSHPTSRFVLGAPRPRSSRNSRLRGGDWQGAECRPGSWNPAGARLAARPDMAVRCSPEAIHARRMPTRGRPGSITSST
jgi:hypothetical protein